MNFKSNKRNVISSLIINLYYMNSPNYISIIKFIDYKLSRAIINLFEFIFLPSFNVYISFKFNLAAIKSVRIQKKN